MRPRVYCTVACAALTALSFGQTMTLASGTMTIAAGTTVELIGGIDWQIASGATLVNDGLIELGSTASIAESSGSPITGAGTEHAAGDLSAPFSEVDPGGLGLVLTMPAALGTFDLVRGHTPLLANGSIESIARWYRLQASPVPGNALDMVLHYDPTELNGGDPADLVLHSSGTTSGPWLYIPGVSMPGQDLVAGSDAGPWEYLTAFTQIITDVPSAGTDASFAVGPTVTSDIVRILAKGNDRIATWQLHDATGRCISMGVGTGNDMTLDLTNTRAGALVLRINERHVFRLLKL
ncbi:MAG: hypothetical protein KDB84_08595 [Flavobacteriales bacterium]|nr:hypothetical protein [Flavobacteriales bacterium]